MDECMVDVEPGSIAGVRCGRRLLQSGACPVHGIKNFPDVREHPVIVEQDVVLENIKGFVSKGDFTYATAYAFGAIGAIAEGSRFPDECVEDMARIRAICEVISAGLKSAAGL